MASVPSQKKKDGKLKKAKKKRETLLSFSLEEEESGETFQLKKNVVSAAAKESRQKALTESESTNTASPYAYSPAPAGDEYQNPNIPSAEAIKAAKEERARKQQLATWKHAIVTGDEEVVSMDFIAIEDVESSKKTDEDVREIPSTPPDEEFQAYEERLIRNIVPKIAQQQAASQPKHIVPTPQVTPCPVIREVNDRISTYVANVSMEVTRYQHALQAAQSGSKTAAASLQTLLVDTEKHCARFEFFEAFKTYVDNLADLTDAKLGELQEIESELRQLRQDTIAEASRKWLSAVTDDASNGSVSISDAVDNVLAFEEAAAATIRDGLLERARRLLIDVDEDYRTQAAVCAKFNTWAQEYPEEYATAYVEDCIPMVIELYVRLDMLEWTPFQAVPLRQLAWIQAIEQGSYQNPDKLIAITLRKIVMPQVDWSFLPYSRSHINGIMDLFTTLRAYKINPKLYERAIVNTIVNCLGEHDLLLSTANVQMIPTVQEATLALLDHICILGHDTAFESLAPVFERLLDLVRTKQSSLLTMDRFRMVLVSAPAGWKKMPIYTSLIQQE